MHFFISRVLEFQYISVKIYTVDIWYCPYVIERNIPWVSHNKSCRRIKRMRIWNKPVRKELKIWNIVHERNRCIWSHCFVHLSRWSEKSEQFFTSILVFILSRVLKIVQNNICIFLRSQNSESNSNLAKSPTTDLKNFFEWMWLDEKFCFDLFIMSWV